jgi:DMSO/TMAO reductase YedYZ molybdopterin-dependent catalytic subunit
MTSILLSLLTLLAAPAGPAAAGEPLLKVGGALTKPGALSLADLETMTPATSTWSAHGEKHEVYGVPLDRLLTRFGFDPGPMGKDVPKHEKRKGWRMVVIASAPDGFQAVLSCAEVFESMGATRAIVAWKIDGKALPDDRGPLRLVVLTDKEPSRSIYNLRKLEVLDLRGAGAPAGR